jgi:protein-tyrosine phosphatase
MAPLTVSNVLTTHTIDDAGDGVLLINCTAGKDRTGIVVALLLLALGVDEETVVADYALTEEVAAPFFARARAAAVARGSDPAAMGELFSSPPSAMRETVDCLNSRHGGIGGFLAKIGVDATERRRVAARLIETRNAPADACAPA